MSNEQSQKPITFEDDTIESSPLSSLSSLSLLDPAIANPSENGEDLLLDILNEKRNIQEIPTIKWREVPIEKPFLITRVKKFNSHYGPGLLIWLNNPITLNELYYTYAPNRMIDEIITNKLPLIVVSRGLKKSIRNPKNSYHSYTLMDFDVVNQKLMEKKKLNNS